MQINPKEGLLVIRKHQKTALKHDIAVEEMDEDKTLITGEVLEDGKLSIDSKPSLVGKTVIFGKYAVYKLTVQGEDFFLLDEQDVLGTCDYKE